MTRLLLDMDGPLADFDRHDNRGVWRQPMTDADRERLNR